MTNSKQNQKATHNATAIQAQGDVHIGPSISEIMEIVSASIQVHTAAARQLVNDRLNDFEKRLTEKIAAGDPKSIQSFSDPDMQSALLDAQKNYVRSNSVDLHNVLTDLIYRKTLEDKQNRISLIINDAIIKSKNLTKVDFSTLALSFILTKVVFSGVITPAAARKNTIKYIAPLLKNLSESSPELEHLCSLGLFLGNPNDSILKPHPLSDLLARRDPGAFNKGFRIDTLQNNISQFDELQKRKLILESDFAKGQYYIAQSPDKLDEATAAKPQEDRDGFRYKKMCEANLIDSATIRDFLSNEIPNYDMLSQAYDRSRLGVLNLTPTGIAIGHSYIAKETGFSGPLNVWITP